jgi:hypothetical protein
LKNIQKNLGAGSISVQRFFGEIYFGATFPANLLWATPQGNLFVSTGTRVIDPLNGATQLKPAWPPTGSFITFEPKKVKRKSMNTKARDFASAWRKRWFGFWGDEEQAMSRPFSLSEHVDETWAPNDLKRLIHYIRSAPVAVVAQAPEAKCGLCDQMIHLSCYRSDGEWLWPDPLAHWVEKHSFVLPDALVDHIRSKKYVPPESLSTAIDKLPWP